MSPRRNQRQRCPWPGDDPLMIRYHDTEWGVPVHRDRKMFEFLVLESFQAGLSWRTVLHKRKNFERAFANFDPSSVAKYSPRDIRRFMNDPGIIRNQQKIFAAINNAKCFLRVRQEYGTFCRYFWQFTNGKTQRNRWRSTKEIPAITPLALTIAADLQRRGFSFLGPTVIYAHMQAVGMVNDHLVTCPQYRR